MVNIYNRCNSELTFGERVPIGFAVLKLHVGLFPLYLFNLHLCSSVLQCVAVCCTWTPRRTRPPSPFPPTFVLQCVAVCCSFLQCVAANSTSCMLPSTVSTCNESCRTRGTRRICVVVSYRVLQCVSLCCSVSQWLRYGVATMSRLLKIAGLFCRI